MSRAVLPHIPERVPCSSVGLSTRISRAKWTAPLYQAETSVVEMLPRAPGAGAWTTGS